MSTQRSPLGPDDLAWFKSSYSGNQGGNCIEVAVSPGTGLEWFKSSHSGNQGGDCIEVASATGTVHVRDSKDKTGPTLAFSPDAWAAFVQFAAGNR